MKKDLFEYYNIDILSIYKNRPNKYIVYTDNFEGKISIRDDYYENHAHEDDAYIDVSFGFRTQKDGELAVAVYLPDLRRLPNAEQKKWQEFIIKDYSLFKIKKNDERFKLYFERYITGNWDIENGVLFKIKEIISEINALTEMTLNDSMFENEEDTYLTFPSAENNHKYEDAHKRVYGFLIDGLQKKTIKKIAEIENIELAIDSDQTVNALKKILPKYLRDEIIRPFMKVSDKRRLASHNTRKPANEFPAFFQFNSDMKDIFNSLKLLKEFIEKITKVSTEVCMKRKNALEMLPEFDKEKKTQPNYSINKFKKIKGKTIDKVEIGFKKGDDKSSESELSILHFTDGTRLSISIVSNLFQLISPNDQDIIKDLTLKFNIDYVPSLKK